MKRTRTEICGLSECDHLLFI